MKTFEELWVELSDKALTRPEGSGTVRELDAGVHAIGKKLVEEAAESWMAAEHESPDRTAEEISQLLYPSPPSDTENMQVRGCRTKVRQPLSVRERMRKRELDAAGFYPATATR